MWGEPWGDGAMEMEMGWRKSCGDHPSSVPRLESVLGRLGPCLWALLLTTETWNGLG